MFYVPLETCKEAWPLQIKLKTITQATVFDLCLALKLLARAESRLVAFQVVHKEF